jgi:glutamine synthetase
LAVLLHEKPFAGINGSGKHNNWSLMAISNSSELDGQNLLEPGETPMQNLRFLLILAGILKGVHQHAGLLRAGIASSGNDHRLGANEAPPAIISVFMGDLLNQILNDIEKGKESGLSAETVMIQLGVNKLPTVMKDNTDRNRTSPFAFTGNKFEFRAVGASASTAFPITILNTVVADGFAQLTEAIKRKGKTSQTVEAAVLEVIREALLESKPIRFEGNNYAAEWVTEAEKRHLPHLRKTPEALAELIKIDAKRLFARLGIFTEAELQSRFHVRLERYIKNLWIEVDTLKAIVDTQILPSVFIYQGLLAQGAVANRELGSKAPQTGALNQLSQLTENLMKSRTQLDETVQLAEKADSDEKRAQLLAEVVSPSMTEVRKVCDELESIVGDTFWPLPKYREMLFLL